MITQKFQKWIFRFPSIFRRLIYLRGKNQEKVTFAKLVNQGDVVFELGGNFGAFTVLFSHLVGRNGLVHAFEPVPPTFAVLEASVRNKCNFDNVVLNQKGIGELEGEFTVHVPAGDLGQASFKEHAIASWQSKQREEYLCKVTTLDTYIARNPEIKRCNFMKIDIEGGELPAMRGAVGFLQQFMPVLHFEYYHEWTKAFGYNATDIVNFLTEIGYCYFYREGLTIMNSPIDELLAADNSRNVICHNQPLKISL